MYEIASNGILQDLIINIEETVTKTKKILIDLMKNSGEEIFSPKQGLLSQKLIIATQRKGIFLVKKRINIG